MYRLSWRDTVINSSFWNKALWVGGVETYFTMCSSLIKNKQTNQPLFEMCFRKRYLMGGGGRGF